MLFSIYDISGDERYKITMDTLRKQLKTNPRTSEGGFWYKKMYTHQMWFDGLYMGAPFYAQYSKEYNEPENFDNIVHQLVLVKQKTRDEETGLLHHGRDESQQQRWADSITGKSPHVWGRGMGWYAMALVDVLDYLP